MSGDGTRVVVLGAGTAGRQAAVAALEEGARVVLVDGGPVGGTTCARVGCMPSKSLVRSGHLARLARDGAPLGVAGAPRFDRATAMKRADHLRHRYATRAADVLPEAIPVLEGDARFEDDTLFVGDQPLPWDRLVLATGSAPRVPPSLRDLQPLYTSRDLWDADLPETVAIVGAGAIGLELACALAGLGGQVTLLDSNDRLGLPLSPPIHDVLLEALRRQGITVLLGEDAEPADGDGPSLQVGDQRVEAEALVVAAGTEPVLPEGLEDVLGIDAEMLGAVEPGVLQVGDRPVFAAGDLVGLPVVHEAVDEGRIAGRNAARWPDTECFPRRTPLSIVFCEPQAAFAGERQAATVFATQRFDDQGRATLDGRPEGAIRLGADEQGVLRWGEVVLHEAEHLAHLLAWSIASESTVTELLSRPYYHPTLEEGLRSCLEKLASHGEPRP